MITIGASLELLIGGVVVIMRIFLSAGSPICKGLIKNFVVVFVPEPLGFIVIAAELVRMRSEAPSIVMNVQKMSVC